MTVRAPDDVLRVERLRTPLPVAYCVLLHFGLHIVAICISIKKIKIVVVSCTGTFILANVNFCLFAWHICLSFAYCVLSENPKCCTPNAGMGSPSNMNALPTNMSADHSRLLKLIMPRNK